MAQRIDRALVLAAGLGTRLRPLTTVRAKPAIPVAGEPLVRRIARWLVGQGVPNLVVNLHHLPHTIAAVLGDGSDIGAHVRYSWEQPVVLGSAGGPRLALPLLGADTFYIVNGDTLTDLVLAPLGRAHAVSGALVTLALVPNREYERYGGVLVDGDRVRGFVPRGAGARGSFHFIGVQAVSAAAFDGVSAGVPANSVGGVYDRLIERTPGSIAGFVCDAAFRDIGTVADYVATSRALAGDSRPPGTILWDNVRIGEGAELEDCIVTDGVDVPAGATYRHSILLRGNAGAIRAIPWMDERG